MNNRKNPEKFSKRGLQRIVEEVRAYHNLNKKEQDKVHFSAHTFRHSFTRYWLVEEGKDSVTIAELMGHSSLEITRQYARYTTKQQREEAEDFVI